MAQATLLLLDDDVSALARTGKQLGAAGYRILKASETAHGTLLFDEQRPDMVLIEVGMEHGAGWGALARFAPLVPVIVVSGHGREEDVVRGLDAGAADYLAKPFRSAELLARVRVRLASASAPLAAPTAEEARAQPTPVADSTTLRLATPPDPAPEGAQIATPSGAEEPVFIHHADERELLTAADVSPVPAETLDDLPLGQRLHAARRRRRLSLVQAESELNIRMYYLQAIEEEKFTLLPSGVITETFLGKYAAYLGQDAGKARAEYRRLHYTEPGAPPPALGGAVPPRGIPRWLVWLLAVLLAVVVSVSAIIAFDPQGAARLANDVRSLIFQP